MILGLSHIAISTENMEIATKRLAEFGYGQRFDSPGLENHGAKTPFLARHQPKHHIRSLAADGAMAIELLDHGGLIGLQASAIIPVFRSQEPRPDWQARPLDSLPMYSDGVRALSVALDQEPLAFYDFALSMTLLWIPANGGDTGLYACVLPTNSIEAIETLLSELRFRPDSNGLWSLLTPLPALKARLFLVVTKPAEGWSNVTLLDMPGCVCLALMARSTDWSPLHVNFEEGRAGFTLSVNGKNSRIAMIRPQHGPIIELVEQPK